MRLRKNANQDPNIFLKKTSADASRGKPGRRSASHWIYWGLVLCLLFLFAMFLMWKKNRIVANGVVATKIYHVTSQYSGVLLKLSCAQGDMVKKNTLLAVVGRNPQTIPEKDFTSARMIKMQHLNSELEDVYLLESKVRRSNALKEYERKKKLFDLDVVVAQEVESALNNFALADAALRSQEARLSIARRENISQNIEQETLIKRDEIEFRNKLLDEEMKGWIFSPQNGEIVILYKTEGETVNAGEKLLTMSDSSSKWIEVAVSQEDMKQIPMGGEVLIRNYWAKNNPVPGKIESVRPLFLENDRAITNQYGQKNFKIIISIPPSESHAFSMGSSVYVEIDKSPYSFK